MPTCANSRRSEHMLLETVTIWMQFGFGGHATTTPTNALTAALAMPNGIRKGVTAAPLQRSRRKTAAAVHGGAATAHNGWCGCTATTFRANMQ